jgi:hypothetical protein
LEAVGKEVDDEGRHRCPGVLLSLKGMTNQPEMTHGPKAVQPIHLLLLFGPLLRSRLSETLEKPFRQRKVGELPRHVDDTLVFRHRLGAPLTHGQMLLMLFLPIGRKLLRHEGVHPLAEILAIEHDD